MTPARLCVVHQHPSFRRFHVTNHYCRSVNMLRVHRCLHEHNRGQALLCSQTDEHRSSVSTQQIAALEALNIQKHGACRDV